MPGPGINYRMYLGSRRLRERKQRERRWGDAVRLLPDEELGPDPTH
tara:strand:+ start:981 stop:1118 length:138 start_codon:yes stop_codon:yes gene_type:complete